MTDQERKYKFIGKGRLKQNRKGGGVAFMFEVDAAFEIEEMDIGDCEMSEDILIANSFLWWM